MNQQHNNFKNGVLRVLAVALMTLALVASLAVVISADPPTELTVDASDLVFANGSGITVTTNGVITKTYDGSDAIALADISVNNAAVVQAGKDVTVNVTAAAWNTADAGVANVSVTFSLSGTDAGDFYINAANYPAQIAPRELTWAAGNATASVKYAVGKTSYSVDPADVAGLPAVNTAAVPAALAAEVSAVVPTVTSVAPVNKDAAGTYPTTAEVTLSNANYTIGAVPVSLTIDKIEITHLEWKNTTGITYGDPKNVSVVAYDADNNAYEKIYTVIYPTGYGNAGTYTLAAELNNANFTETATLAKTKSVTIAPKNYAVTMKDQTIAGDGRTAYTIGVEGEDLPANVKGLVTYTVNGEPFKGSAKAGTYLIVATLPVGGNYTFTSGGKSVTSLSATLTVTVDQIAVDVEETGVSIIILTGKDGLPADMSAIAVRAVSVKLPKGTKYAQSFQVRLTGAAENETYTIIVPLSYELYSKGCKELSASSLYVYDASGEPVVAADNGYTVTASDGYFKIEGVKGSLGTYTFTIAPQYSDGLAWWVLLIIILVLVVILLIVMFFIGRAVRKSMADKTTEAPANVAEPAEEAENYDDAWDELPEVEILDDADLAEEEAEPAEEAEPEENAADDASEEEPAVETLAAVDASEEVAEEVDEEAEEATDDIPDSLQAKNGSLRYIDTRKKPDLYEEMLALEAAGKARILYRYRKSYQSKLAQADTKIQDYYVAIKTALLHYRGVKARKSWNYEAFHCGRNPIVKMIPKTKTIYLYFGIDPAELTDAKYDVTDVSDKKKFADTPSLLKVRGDRKFKFALELIEKLCGETLALKPSKKPVPEITVNHMTDEELLDAGLIRLLAAAAPLEN